jgi:hypothetical protein
MILQSRRLLESAQVIQQGSKHQGKKQHHANPQADGLGLLSNRTASENFDKVI